MPYSRFVVMLQNICDYAACSRHAHALVCLHAALILPPPTAGVPMTPAQLHKSANLSGAFSLPPKPQSASERAISVLSP